MVVSYAFVYNSFFFNEIDLYFKIRTEKSEFLSHYTGRLIDGTVFDSTEGQLPACFRVDELIVGWQAALLRMHEGDTLQIILPAKYGYGSAKIDGIPAWSTLDFTLTLVKIL